MMVKNWLPLTQFLRVLLESNHIHILLKTFNLIERCGQRSGYLEAVNFESDAKAQLYKLASVLLCPNTAGQVLVSSLFFPLFFSLS